MQKERNFVAAMREKEKEKRRGRRNYWESENKRREGSVFEVLLLGKAQGVC